MSLSCDTASALTERRHPVASGQALVAPSPARFAGETPRSVELHFPELLELPELPEELPPPPVALLLPPDPVLPGLVLLPLVPPGELGLLVELPPAPLGLLLLPELPVPPELPELPVPPLLPCGHPIAAARSPAPASASQVFRIVMSFPFRET